MRRKINIRKNLLYLWTTYYSWKKLQIEDRKTHVGHENMRRKKNMKEIYMRIWEEIWTWGRSFPINESHMIHQKIFKSEIGGLMLAKTLNLSAEDSCWKKLQIWVQKIHVGRSFKSECRRFVLEEASNLSAKDWCWKKLQIWVRIMIHGRSFNHVVMRTIERWSMKSELRQWFMHKVQIRDRRTIQK